MSDEIKRELMELVAKELNMDSTQIDPDIPLIKYSLDSFSLFNLKYILEQKYQKTLFQVSPIEEITVNNVVNEISRTPN